MSPKPSEGEFKGDFGIRVAITAGFYEPVVDNGWVMFDRTFGPESDRYEYEVLYSSHGDGVWYVSDVDGEECWDYNSFDEVVIALYQMSVKESKEAVWAKALFEQLMDTNLVHQIATDAVTFVERFKQAIDDFTDSPTV